MGSSELTEYCVQNHHKKRRKAINIEVEKSNKQENAQEKGNGKRLHTGGDKQAGRQAQLMCRITTFKLYAMYCIFVHTYI